jgi:hypothetical protein
MARWSKIVLPGEFRFQTFDFRAENFHGLAATFANEVIVVFFGIQTTFETADAVPEVLFTGKARTAEQLESAVHGGQTDGRIPPANRAQQFLGSAMPFKIQKGPQDLQALLGTLVSI